MTSLAFSGDGQTSSSGSLSCLKAPYPSQAVSGRFKRGVTGCNQNTDYVPDRLDTPKRNLRYIRNQPAVWQRTHNTEFDSHSSRCCLEFVIQPPAPKSNPLSPVQFCCHQDLLRVGEIWSSDLCPRLTNSIGSPLSPGQTCCHQVPKHLCHAAVANLVRSRNCHYASRGIGRIALRD
ncbi:hypothetical protein PIB30_025017 [Stylosanthes scabra]|uniref:Uncharacterized protein n=1 Tax=Stylosanthes scabra TaxID=79078 RepID=A0ABU6QAG4_9FABA|nr:hypothetical protein [Stylosanthes scabra]